MDTRNNAKVWYNYANYLRDQEDKSTAAYCYKVEMDWMELMLHNQILNMFSNNWPHNSVMFPCLQESIRLWPDYVIALNNLATVTEDQEDIEKLLLKALHLDSGLALEIIYLQKHFTVLRQENVINNLFYHLQDTWRPCLIWPTSTDNKICVQSQSFISRSVWPSPSVYPRQTF